MKPSEVAKTHTVRKPIPEEKVVKQFLRMLYRGVDEGHIAQRGGSI